MYMERVDTMVEEMTGPRSDFETRRFEEMMSATRRRAYSMAFQLTRSSTDAEDLMQETWVKAWKGFDSYMPGRPFLNWLLRIMQRAYLDGRRRDNPIRKAESLNALISPEGGDTQELQIPDRGPRPDEDVIQLEFAKELRKALQELPDVYREAIELCDLEGMSYSEIADAQDTTIGTVRSRIHRGRKFMRAIASKNGLLNY